MYAGGQCAYLRGTSARDWSTKRKNTKLEARVSSGIIKCAYSNTGNWEKEMMKLKKHIQDTGVND